MGKDQEGKRPTCEACGRELDKEDGEWATSGFCLDCTLTLMGGAAHKMAEGIREKRAKETQDGGKQSLSGQKKKGDVQLVLRRPKGTSDADLKELAQAMHQEMVDKGLVEEPSEDDGS